MNSIQSPADAASLRRRIAEGFDLLTQGRVADAAQAAATLLAGHPGDPEVQFFASEARLAIDDPDGARDCLDAAIALRPDEPVLRLKLAEVLVGLRQRQAARAAATRAAELAPSDGAIQRAVGRIFTGCGDPAAARAHYERALSVGYAEPEMLFELATAQKATGDLDAADAAIAALLAAMPQAGAVLHLRSSLRPATTERNHVAELEALLATPFANDADRVGALYALGRELEELGENERAFAAIREGAALRRAQMRGYDPALEIATIDAMCAAYGADEMARPVPGHNADGPIFVVGMPGSGTALVERILASHSAIGSAGELLDFGQALGSAVRRLAPTPGQSLVEASMRVDFAGLGRDYERGAREAAPARPLFVDAMPINYMYCGLIRRALPQARIVHVTRDAMATGYALYKTLFGQAYLYSYDLGEIAEYLACHQRTMRHWQSMLGEGIVTVRYEDLVADPEGQARRLLESLGLAWEPVDIERIRAVEVGSWREHAADLEPLRQRLAELGVSGA